MADTQFTDPDAQAIAAYAKTAPASAASGLTDPDAQAIAAYQASQAQQAPAAVQQPSSSILPQPIQDIRNWVSAHGLGSSPEDFYAAGIHNAMKPLHGTAQLIEHGLGGAANLVAPGSSVAQFFNQDNAQNDAYLRKWEQDYQNSTPDNASTYAGAAAGNAATLAGGVGERLGQAGDYVGNLIPKIPQFMRNVISGGAQGTILGLTQPITSPTGGTVGDLVSGNAGPSFAAQKLRQAELGGVTGGGFSTLAGIGGSVGNALKPLVNPSGSVRDYLNNLLGDKVPQVLQNLQNAPTFVPGSIPTSAQAAGTPELVMAEKALGNQFPAFRTAQMERGNTNNAARLDALQSVAGTPADLKAAVDARKATTQPQIDSLLTNGNPVQVQPVMDALDSLKNSSLGVRPTIKGAISDLQSELTSRAPNGTIAPDVMDGLRQNIGDYLRKNAPNGAVGTQEGAAFGPIKDQISQVIEQSNPGYLNYLADYARLSQPITDARAASGILDRLGNGSLNSAQQVQLNPRGFNAALNKATSGPYPLSPNAQNTLEGIQQDLQRDTISNSVKAPGSDTAYNLAANGWLANKLYGNNFGGTGKGVKLAAGVLGNFIPGVGFLGGFLGADKLGQGIADRMGNAAADVMMNPSKMIEQLQALQRTNPQAAQTLQRYLTQQGALQAGQKAGQ